MKIARAVRELYKDLVEKHSRLKESVDTLIQSRKEQRWHYESRVKGEESFALKLETGRIENPSAPEDFFACTIVVENHARIAAAEDLVNSLFSLIARRPKEDVSTHLSPENFGFDDLRLYVNWKDAPQLPTSGFSGMVFEIQIKTFLQHAWGIATHDFVYKSDDVDWAESRIAFQVKAMLEHAELSIGEAQTLSTAKLVGRCDKEFRSLKDTIAEIKKRWDLDNLPTDLKRLAQNILHLSKTLAINLSDIWDAVDAETTRGRGAKQQNLSPYSSTLQALVEIRGAKLFDPLKKDWVRQKIYVPQEVELPPLEKKIKEKLVIIT
ncbi:MAG: hypothetical protein JNL67_16270 [Planctomycetaceae bacterium]|nr:hypothetical protein [Planctomycetaceae bacterium]